MSFSGCTVPASQIVNVMLSKTRAYPRFQSCSHVYAKYSTLLAEIRQKRSQILCRSRKEGNATPTDHDEDAVAAADDDKFFAVVFEVDFLISSIPCL